MNTNQKLNYQLYVQRENEFYHEPYKYEHVFYDAIRRGDVDLIQENQKKYSKYADEGKGNLSPNPFRNQLYHFITNTALITRTCVDSGLSHEVAFTLSDLYIRQADACTTAAQIMKLNDVMVLDFAKRMRALRKEQVFSPHVRKCIDYILDNLHKKITAAHLANYLNLNRSYLSTMFKKETGISIKSYIQEKRLETAENMLRCTDFKYSDIAHTLCFTSQSYFCKLFREKNGCTPKEYRKRFYS